MGCISKALPRGTHYLHGIMILELQRAKHHITAKWHKAPETLQHKLTSSQKRHWRPVWTLEPLWRLYVKAAARRDSTCHQRCPTQRPRCFPVRRRRGWIVPLRSRFQTSILRGGKRSCTPANSTSVHACWGTRLGAQKSHPLWDLELTIETTMREISAQRRE